MPVAERSAATLDPYRGPAPQYAARATDAHQPGFSADARGPAVHGETRYKAARRDRDVFGHIAGGDADTDTLPSLPELRRRSADAARNNPLALAGISAKATNVVGTGLRLNAAIDRDALGLSDADADAWEAQAEAEWQLFASSPLCDLRKTLTFSEQQDLAYRSHIERGDHFIALVSRPGPRARWWPYSFALQHIEAERVSNPHHARDTERLIAGIEKDAQGAPVRIHVADHHPGSLLRHGKRPSWTPLRLRGARTGRPLVLHLYRTLREGQTRGVPELAPVLEVLKQLDRYIDAEVDRAANSALFMAFLTTADGDGMAALGGELVDDRQHFYEKFQQDRYAIDHSSIASLFPGDKMEFADPKSPNPSAETFIRTFATLVGAALEIPQEVLLRHFSSSYSAARGALIMAQQHFHARRAWLASRLCQPVYEAVLTDAIAAGRLHAPGFLDDPFARQAWLGAEWIGDAPPIIDENKAVSAARDRVEAGFSSRKRETVQLTGQDYDHVRRQRAKEARQEPRQMALELPSADDLDHEDQR